MPRIIVPVLLFSLLSGTFSHFAQSQISEETRKKRETFLKAREQMKTFPPDPTPTPVPRPRVTPRPHTTPKARPDHTPDETPEPTPRRTPRPTATPQLTPETPEPTPIATPIPRPTRSPTPQPTASPIQETPKAPITIRRSGNEEVEIVPAPRSWWGGPRYRYITGGVKKGIDDAPVKRGRWKYIVVHNSGTRQGNAKIFDYYHRHSRKMPNGMAYHFVIGNGTSSKDGQIELGSRWNKQINGGHVHSDYLNYISLGICLVGDFNRDRPTQKQLEALDELIRYLRKRCGKVEGKYSIVRAHKEINPVPTDCPGDRFPVSWLHKRFD